MAEKITVPTLGESVTEATVSKWLKSQGEKVAVGPQSAEKEYPTTIRTAEGDYLKVWHGESLRRGTAITVDEVIWENGWKDTFIVTC